MEACIGTFRGRKLIKWGPAQIVQQLKITEKKNN